MPQLFRPQANALAIAIVCSGALALVAGAVIAAALGTSPYATGQGRTPDQPVPFSHEHHVGGLGIDCRYCHSGVDEGRFAGIPTTATCMSCHSQLWTNAQMLAPVRESLAQDEPLRWVRVHDLADYSYFDHRAHVTNGVGCESCHGRVDSMPLMRQAAPLTMQWCLDCHRDPGPRLRPTEAITRMGYAPAADTVPGHEMINRYGIQLDRLTECSTCHR